MENINASNNTIEINWEDAPEGTTHYDPATETKGPFWNKLENGAWYWYHKGAYTWHMYNSLELMYSDLESFIPKPKQPTEDSYTTPKADPFIETCKGNTLGELLNEHLGEMSIEEYVRSIYEQGEDKFSYMYATKAAIESALSPRSIILKDNETESIVREKTEELFCKEDLNVSWYDYEKEEVVGLPEKGAMVYDSFLQEEVEYLGKLQDKSIIILAPQGGNLYDRQSGSIKPLNYKDSPMHQARKEQHKQLEVLVGDVDSNLQGCTHKGGAIELYNKGWRVSKAEDV